MSTLPSFSRSDFPDDFVFGTATSSYQIEGSSYGGAGSSHWDTFSENPNNIFDGSNGSVACDHYHRYPEDLDLIQTAGFDAYRFSFSWARIMTGKDQINGEGLDFYDRLLDAMLERGLKPYATLYHWDLPSYLADCGGWANRDTAVEFAAYTKLIVDRFGDRLATIATVNEPWCVAWLSYFLGHHAPGLTDIRAATRAMHHILLAHGLAVEVLRSQQQTSVGIVLNFEHASAADNHPDSQVAARHYDAIYNRWFLEAITLGEYPVEIVELLHAHMPVSWEKDMDCISADLDWMGINYYTRKLISKAENPRFGSFTSVDGDLPTTSLGWEIYPEGLDQLLERIVALTGDLPLYITENGMASDDLIEDGKVSDSDRLSYIWRHMDVARLAIEKGFPIKGYFVWSLLDNFEWAFGYSQRFGIVHVDYNTLTRTPKSSYYAIKNLLQP